MKPVCVVAGVGPGNGAAFARRFASEGYAVALLARSTSFSVKVASTLPDARVYECDVAAAGSIARAFDGIRTFPCAPIAAIAPSSRSATGLSTRSVGVNSTAAVIAMVVNGSSLAGLLAATASALRRHRATRVVFHYPPTG